MKFQEEEEAAVLVYNRFIPYIDKAAQYERIKDNVIVKINDEFNTNEFKKILYDYLEAGSRTAFVDTIKDGNYLTVSAWVEV